MERVKLLYIGFSLYIGVIYTEQSRCMRGFYLNTLSSKTEVCVPCEDGLTFMPLEEHMKRECYDCTQITDYNMEILITPCNRTHDAHILCQPGYYRKRGRKYHREHCVQCTTCPNPTRQCQGHHDTVCCGDSHYEAVLNHHGVYVCKPRFIRCTRGEFFDQHTGGCTPCPKHTYMPAQDHTSPQCLPCRTLPKGNTTRAIIIQPCTETTPTLFGCPEGYFRDLGQDLTLALTCSPCRECETVSRPCDMFHDTVCCGDSHYEAVLNHHGVYVCNPRFIRCTRGEFFDQQTGGCTPCPKHTYMPAQDHTSPQCLPCRALPKGNTTRAIIIQPCTETTPTLFGCPDGYFRDLGHDLTLALTCSPCRKCQTVSRLCDMFHDTVCCPGTDDNISGETSGGSTCLPDKKITCGPGQYVYINQSDGLEVCHGCPSGTFMDQVNHTSTACKSCSDILADFGTCCTSANITTKSENIVYMFSFLAVGYIVHKLFTTFIFFHDYWSYFTDRNAVVSQPYNKIKLLLYSFLHTTLFVLRMCLILSFSGVIGSFDEPYLFFALVIFVIFTSGWDNWIMKRNKALFDIANAQWVPAGFVKYR